MSKTIVRKEKEKFERKRDKPKTSRGQLQEKTKENREDGKQKTL